MKVSAKYNFVVVVAMTSAVILLLTLTFITNDSIGDLEVTLTSMDNRLTNVESRLTNMDIRLTNVESDIGSMKLALARLENK